ncbi:hypothetical protein CSUI_005512, partial [Cystoisospora suis]
FDLSAMYQRKVLSLPCLFCCFLNSLFLSVTDK